MTEVHCLLEPVAGNMGVMLAEPLFLKRLRQLTRKHQAILIFDEVITGLRAGLHGAQKRLNVTPDITVLGKVIGGGLPVGAFGASQRIMRHLAPLGPVYQAGTLSGNPLSMAAGLATLTELRKKNVFKRIEHQTERLVIQLLRIFESNGIPASIPHIGSMYSIFFQRNAPTTFSAITPAHVKRYQRFFNHMLNHGIYFPPSAYEACFLSSTHGALEIQKTLRAAKTFQI